jgi:Leucine-rich repeat (LRR) protein
MKKLYTLLFITLIGFIGNAQIVNIPDANFKAKLLAANTTNQIASTQTPSLSGNVTSYNIIDTNNDGEIQVSEALAIKWLKVNASVIADLTGIQSFSNLMSLNCATNQLTNFSLSSLTILETLNCSGNQISAINLVGLSNLLTLNCSSNLLTVLNLSGLSNLNNLNCSNNQLTNLNVSGISILTVLDFSNNSIQNINLSSSASLESLSMGANPFSTLVDLNGLVNLQFLFIRNLPVSAISPLTVNVMPNLTSLTTLVTDGSNLGNINYSLIPNLNSLFCRNSGLTDISNIPNTLSLFVCENNQLTTLNLTGFGSLQAINFANNPISSLTFGNHPNLITMFGGATSLTFLDVSSLPALSSLSIFNSANMIGCNVKNGINTSLSFNLCPNLQCINADDDEISAIQNNIITYGYTNCTVSSNCTLENANFEIQDSLKFYPIPAKNTLNLEMEASLNLKSINIYDVLGQIVLAITNAVSVSTIDVSNLKTGTYFINVNTDKGTANRKFIKE